MDPKALTTLQGLQVPDEQIIDKFHDVFKQLIDALVEFTADDEAMSRTLLGHKVKYDAMRLLDDQENKDLRRHIVETFHDQVHPYYDKIEAGDLSFLDQVPLMRELELMTILDGADDDDRGIMVQYLRLLVANARLYDTKKSGYLDEWIGMSQKCLGAASAMASGQPVNAEDMQSFENMMRDERFKGMLSSTATMLQGMMDKKK
jgi:hypothetical protein